ncbi:MAG: hypothetical protein FRX49_03365 [Trebouxia sp. A1-2]|nr:MAG: hypothetical protein FRX49_03365 [Trebouxia sp. A1-2]
MLRSRTAGPAQGVARPVGGAALLPAAVSYLTGVCSGVQQLIMPGVTNAKMAAPLKISVGLSWLITKVAAAFGEPVIWEPSLGEEGGGVKTRIGQRGDNREGRKGMDERGRAYEVIMMWLVFHMHEDKPFSLFNGGISFGSATTSKVWSGM